MKGVKVIDNIFGENSQTTQNVIPIDKERRVEIDIQNKKVDASKASEPIQITSISKSVPIQKVNEGNTSFSSTVSKNTVSTIVELKKQSVQESPIVEKKELSRDLSLNELLGGDKKIEEATSADIKTIPVVAKKENKIEVKNANNADDAKSILMKDLEYLDQSDKPKVIVTDQNTTVETPKAEAVVDAKPKTLADELVPKTKEDRMQALQNKIKSLNKNISSGGSTNIGSGADPYRI
jgi:hypothetical protein